MVFIWYQLKTCSAIFSTVSKALQHCVSIDDMDSIRRSVGSWFRVWFQIMEKCRLSGHAISSCQRPGHRSQRGQQCQLKVSMSCSRERSTSLPKIFRSALVWLILSCELVNFFTPSPAAFLAYCAWCVRETPQTYQRVSIWWNLQ